MKKKLLIGVTVACALLQLLYGFLFCFVPKGLELRAWFTYGSIPVITFVWQTLIVIWAFVFGKTKLSQIKRAGIRVTAKVLLSILSIAMVLFMGVVCLVMMFGEEVREQDNENGTLSVMKTNFLDPSDYFLYEKVNLLYRKYIRDAKDFSDTDPTITQEEFKERMEEERKAHEAEAMARAAKTEADLAADKQVDEALPIAYDDDWGASANPENNSESADSADDSAKGDTPNVLSDEEQRILDGYHAVFEFMPKKAGYTFEQTYDAKGHSRVIVYEDDTVICFIACDEARSDRNTCYYTYSECEKGIDGSFSPYDGIKNDCYVYDVVTGCVSQE